MLNRILFEAGRNNCVLASLFYAELEPENRRTQQFYIENYIKHRKEINIYLNHLKRNKYIFRLLFDENCTLIYVL